MQCASIKGRAKLNKTTSTTQAKSPRPQQTCSSPSFNIAIPAKEARFMTMNISNFYLVTPLKRPEYIRINIRDIPDEIIEEYRLKKRQTQTGPCTP